MYGPLFAMLKAELNLRGAERCGAFYFFDATRPTACVNAVFQCYAAFVTFIELYHQVVTAYIFCSITMWPFT